MAEIAHTLRLLTSQIQQARETVDREAQRVAELAAQLPGKPVGPTLTGDAARLAKDSRELLVQITRLATLTEAVELIRAENGMETDEP